MPGSTAAVRRPPFLSVPAWDISLEEISEWNQTPGMGFTAYTAECIIKGQYDDGQEIYPSGSSVYQEISRERVDKVMSVLAERGMARKEKGEWRAIAPGRMAPSVLRAVGVLLAVSGDMPPGLAAGLESWKATLDAIAACDGSLDGLRATGQAPTMPAKPVPAIAAG
jgi:hypothetical protein